MVKEEIIWVAWERHQRTITLSNFVNAKLFIFKSNHSLILRYLILSIKTIKTLVRQKPAILFVQNPSIVLSLLVCLLKPLFRYYLIVDSHNAGVAPESKILIKLSFVIKYIIRKSNLTIVTNEKLAKLISTYSGTPFVLPDKLPEFDVSMCKKARVDDVVNVVLISTFGIDEPYLEFLKSTKLLKNRMKISITGKIDKIDTNIYSDYKDIVSFTDFLPEQDYICLLYGADIIIDLTTREDCLVCGAYEAVSLMKPLILSDTIALKQYFYKGVVYTENLASDIAKNIEYANENIATLQREIRELNKEIALNWSSSGTCLVAHLEKYII